MSDTRTPIGTPITTAQAIRAILREIHSPVLGDIELDSGPGHTLRRIKGDDGCYSMLSGGEKKLVDIAWSIWAGPSPEGAHISAIGGLDRTLRRKVLIILFYLYLGHDLPWNGVDPVKFHLLFEDRAKTAIP